MTVLLREAIGERLRRTRTAQHRTLREVSRTARVSLGYLSEVERGRKEASSELLAAICDALSLPLADLLNGVAGDLRPHLVNGRTGEPRVGFATEGSLEGGRLAKAGTGDSKAELLIAHPLPRKLTKAAKARAAAA
jgi:transcriptional regulator with XRE-family HTH domain